LITGKFTDKSYIKVPYDIYAHTGKSRITKPVKYVTGFACTKIGDLSGIQGIKKSDSPNRIDTVLYSADMFNRTRGIVHAIYVFAKDVRALLLEAETREFNSRTMYEDDLKRLYNNLINLPDDEKLYCSRPYQGIGNYSDPVSSYCEPIKSGSILSTRNYILGALTRVAEEYGMQLPYYTELDDEGNPYMYIEGKDTVDLTSVNYMPRDEFIKKYTVNDKCDIEFVRWASELEKSEENRKLVFMLLMQKDWNDADSRMYCLAAAKLQGICISDYNTPQAKLIESMFGQSKEFGYSLGTYMIWHSTRTDFHAIPKDLYDEFVIPSVKEELEMRMQHIMVQYYDDREYDHENCEYKDSIYGYYDDIRNLIKIG
jgi:hypothetical protein